MYQRRYLLSFRASLAVGLSSLLVLFVTSAFSQRCSIDRNEMPNECKPLSYGTAFFIPPVSYNITLEDITRQVTVATLSLSTVDGDKCR